MLQRHSTIEVHKGEVQALVEEYGKLTVNEASDAANFFFWYVTKKLDLGQSMEIESLASGICAVCDTVRNTYERVGDRVTPSAGMVAWGQNENHFNFGLSIPAIMVQCNPEIKSESDEACPNSKCGQK